LNATERLQYLLDSLRDPAPFDSVAFHQAAMSVVEWAVRDAANMSAGPIGRVASPAALEAQFSQPVPEAGRPIAELIEQFQSSIIANSLRTQHPRFLAFVPTAPTPMAILGDWLTAAANLYAGHWFESSSAATLERVVLNWVREWMDMPSGTEGILTSGGSEANLTALILARDQHPREVWPRLCLYASAQRHWSIDRALKIIGFDRKQLVEVPTDVTLRISPGPLHEMMIKDRRAALIPWVIVANGGATSTGVVDRLAELAAIAQIEQTWYHIDAAYGWSSLLTDEGQAIFVGIGHADSVTFDPHKWFGQTVDVGGLLVRNGKKLEQSFSQQADYLQDASVAEGEVNFADRGIGLTRRFRAFKIWFALQAMGLNWHRQFIQRCMRLADYAQFRLEEPNSGFEVLCPRQLSIICFRRVPTKIIRNDPELDALNMRIPKILRDEGNCLISSTRLRGRVVLRMCFVNGQTTIGDIDAIIHRVRQIE